MAGKTAKHGTRAGYDVELVTGNICDRCRRAKTVYQRQYTKAGKTAGLKYRYNDVIDNLYDAPLGARQTSVRTARRQNSPSRDNQKIVKDIPPTVKDVHDTTEQTETADRPSIGDRVGDALRSLSQPGTQPYVETGEMPSYLHTTEPDPDPIDPESSHVKDEDFVITRDGMVLIEQNMGTYLSVIGMTLEMVDPYCGPILAENFDNIVGRWSKVIARYPAAAKIFMSQGGGMIMDWIGAIQATWPVLYATYEHHLARTVKTDGRRVMRVVNNGTGPTVDPTMPPQPEYDYTTR